MQLQACLDVVMQGLAKSIAWDGEGATCLIEVTVTGANSEAAAAKIARSVGSSSLVKGSCILRDPTGEGQLLLLDMLRFLSTKTSCGYCLEIFFSRMVGNNFHLTGLQQVTMSGRLVKSMV